MNITYAKFFQPVQLTKSPGIQDVVNYARDKEYNMTLDGNFIKVKSKLGGETVHVTIFNVAFLRTDTDDTSPKTSGKNPPKAKADQA